MGRAVEAGPNRRTSFLRPSSWATIRWTGEAGCDASPRPAPPPPWSSCIAGALDASASEATPTARTSHRLILRFLLNSLRVIVPCLLVGPLLTRRVRAAFLPGFRAGLTQ